MIITQVFVARFWCCWLLILSTQTKRLQSLYPKTGPVNPCSIHSLVEFNSADHYRSTRATMSICAIPPDYEALN